MKQIQLAVFTTWLTFVIFTPAGPAQPGTIQSYIWLSNLQMIDTRVGWAQSAEGWSGNFAKGAFGSVVRTTDGGVHWKDVRPTGRLKGFFLRQALTSHIAWADSVWFGASGPDSSRGQLLGTTDGGKTWKDLSIPAEGWIRSLFFINLNDGWLMSWNGIYRSDNGGKTWAKIATVDVSRNDVRITFSSTTSGWISGFVGKGSDGLFLLATNDGGHTWQRQMLSLPRELSSPQVWLRQEAPRFFSSKDGVFVVSYYSPVDASAQEAGTIIYLTHDSGKSWTYTTPLMWKIRSTGAFRTGYASSSFVDTNHGWVTDSDVLYRTRNGGRTWTKIHPGEPFRDNPELEFISPLEGWAPGIGFHLPYLLKTVDGGRTWKDLSFIVMR